MLARAASSGTGTVFTLSQGGSGSLPQSPGGSLRSPAGSTLKPRSRLNLPRVYVDAEGSTPPDRQSPTDPASSSQVQCTLVFTSRSCQKLILPLSCHISSLLCYLSQALHCTSQAGIQETCHQIVLHQMHKSSHPPHPSRLQDAVPKQTLRVILFNFR